MDARDVGMSLGNKGSSCTSRTTGVAMWASCGSARPRSGGARDGPGSITARRCSATGSSSTPSARLALVRMVLMVFSTCLADDAPRRDSVLGANQNAPMGDQAPTTRTARAARGASTWFRGARRRLALAVVLAAAIVLGMSAYTGAFRICRPQTLVVGDHLVMSRLCDPLSLADLAPLWILALALLWPDIKSLSLFGVGLEKRHEQLERDLAAVASLTPGERVGRSLDEKARAEWPAGSAGTIPDDGPPAGGQNG